MPLRIFLIVSAFASLSMASNNAQGVLLTHLQSQLAFQVNQEIVIPPGKKVLAFYDGKIRSHSGECLFHTCRAINASQTVYPGDSDGFQLRRIVPSGCEIQLKKAFSEPKKIEVGKRLIAKRRDSWSVRVPTCPSQDGMPTHCRFPDLAPTEYDLIVVTFYLDSENINSVRCGSGSPSELTLDFMRRHLGESRFQILGAIIEGIE